MKGLIEILDKIKKVYLPHAPGNSLLDDALTKEHIDAAREYNTEQVQIMSILVEPSPGAILPPPGMKFSPSLPTV